MDAKLQKSLTDLIDETLGELEELRKSRFAAAEISLAGPGDTKIGGQEANGKLGKDEDKKKDDEDEDKKDKDMDKGENQKADPNAGHHKPVAGEGDEHGQGPDKSRHGSESRGSEGKNSSADPGEIGPVGKADDDKKKDKKDKDEPHKDDPDHEEKEKKMAQKLLDMHKGELKKSFDENDSLMKSYVETRVKPLEDKLTTILELVNKIAEQPVPAKGVTARGGAPLFKSEEAGGEPLHKAEVASKLFELKKSGKPVDSLDIAKAEMGQELGAISKKYQLS